MKQTEIGLIPDDWEVKRLGDVTRIQAGGTPSTLFEAYWNGNIRWMNSGELNLKRVYEVEGRITELGLNNSSTHLIPKGCVLIGLAGQGKTRGTAAINYVDLCTNQSIAAIFPSDFHNSDFLYHVMDNKYQELRELSDGGGGRGGLNLKILNDIQIPLPPLPEQQRIAKALSDVDALIFTTEKLLQKKRNIKQGTMQELLTGKKRLPGFAKSNNTKMTELGEIPEDWELKSFYELFDICTETISVDSIKKESYIGTENMLQDKMGIIKNETALNYLKVREYRKQDILVSNIRPYLKKIWFADKNGGCSTDVLVFRKKRNFDNAEFLFKIVSDERFFNIVNDNAVGTKMPRGDKNIIKHVLFAIPTTKEEQTAIANVLSIMDKEIETLNTKLEKYRNLKTAMMQQLLTGKIRLVN